MTHDYKEALDEINRIFYYESPVWVSIYKEPKLSDKVMNTIRRALTLAAEYDKRKAAVTILEQKLRDVNKAHDRAEDKLDKAKWRPIETAPKDGTDIYATRVDVIVFRPSIVYWENFEGRGWLCSRTHYPVNSQPTHWMPLPDAPEQR